MKPVIGNKYGSKHCLQYSQIQVLLRFKPKLYAYNTVSYESNINMDGGTVLLTCIHKLFLNIAMLTYIVRVNVPKA